jgi:fatty-acyl-CoA synthase
MASYLDEVRGRLPQLREVIPLSEWDDLVAQPGYCGSLPDVQPDDVAQIQYTSGTTGHPKGAMLHHRGITNNARFYAARLGLGTGDVLVNPMPLFHTAGCAMGVLGAAQAQATHVPVLAFDAGLVLDLAESLRGNVLAGVPTMLVSLLEHADLPRRDLSSVRLVVSGGSPVPAELAQRVEAELGVRFCIVFGTTECSPLISQTHPGDVAEDRTGTLGQPLPQTEVMVSDPRTGQPVPVGQVGELCARGYLVMKGYYKQPEATAAAVDAGGWYHTRDLASMNSRGYLSVEGRISDMIIRGGENIYPREIEDVLYRHPGVAEAAVVGTPDERWGETVVAFVRAAPGASLAGEDLRTWCREHLAAYKTPVRWIFVAEFPLTASGKIQKFILRESLTAPTVRSGA